MTNLDINRTGLVLDPCLDELATLLVGTDCGVATVICALCGIINTPDPVVFKVDSTTGVVGDFCVDLQPHPGVNLSKMLVTGAVVKLVSEVVPVVHPEPDVTAKGDLCRSLSNDCLCL